MHRLPALVALLLFLAVGSVRAAEVEFARLWTGWRSAESFERISEYFTGKENTGGQIVVRTHPDERAGFYYLVRVKNAGPALPGAKFTLEVIAPTSPDTKTYTFPAELEPHSQVFLLGLTGADWPGSKAHPVAWKLTLAASDGRVVASAQSFLWEKPAKP